MAKLVQIIIFLIFNTWVVSSQSQNAYQITVNIKGLDNNNGKLMVGLYASKAQFLKKDFKHLIGKIDNKTSTVTFNNVPNGVYAISFIHDKNDNNKLDTNFMGIPKEPYGCSNNARGFMGPPKWNDAKFTIKGKDKTLEIAL